MTRTLALGIAMALVGGSSIAQRPDVQPAPSADLAQALTGRVAGKPVNCITASRVSGPDIIDQNTIIYRETRSRVWLNRLSEKCPLVRDNDILVIERFGDQLCRYDRFRLVNRNSGFGSAYCILGGFTPYDLPKPVPKR